MSNSYHEMIERAARELGIELSPSLERIAEHVLAKPDSCEWPFSYWESIIRNADPESASGKGLRLAQHVLEQ
jgi:hypothetical protein